MSELLPNEEYNGKRFIWSNGLQNIGDQIIAAKTVLPWMLQAAGAPGFIIAMLVPVRESGSMLPQAALTPWVTAHKYRKGIWLMGAVGQGIAAILMGIASLFLTGTALGIVVLLLLAIFATFRSLCSIASKDVQGRTIHKGGRGRITGRATELGGFISLAVGLAMTFIPALQNPNVLKLLIIIAGFSWFLAALVFKSIKEPEDPDADGGGLNKAWWKDTWELFRDHRNFRNFVIVRALMLVSALSTAFIVTLSQETGQDISGLGTFLVAGGLSSLLGGRISGIWSDASSKRTMSVGAAVATAVILLTILATSTLGGEALRWILPTSFFLLNLAHTAIRVARKTYIVDMAESDQRTRYVGAANTMMGIILLLVGTVSGVIAMWGSVPALLFLAAVGLVGVFAAARLPEVSKSKDYAEADEDN
ncbi:MAG: MFS transporter [Actinomycetaceae bacterium]|nr:MFS transporter [Actinomycetaceae bacterium]